MRSDPQCPNSTLEHNTFAGMQENLRPAASLIVVGEVVRSLEYEADVADAVADTRSEPTQHICFWHRGGGL